MTITKNKLNTVSTLSPAFVCRVNGRWVANIPVTLASAGDHLIELATFYGCIEVKVVAQDPWMFEP